ncbi:SVEP1 [Symbiodinium natans]|uniref:SVEP1 protein n=1 Tax=Symbiodinium natans TaxID=878477 RepID=A0A812QPC7_9DINO|nr:SVEP1 [Symbiodinium natans]
MVNAWLLFAEWLNGRGGIQIGRAKYLLELLLADEKDWQMASASVRFLLGPWRSSGNDNVHSFVVNSSHYLPEVIVTSMEAHAEVPQAFSFRRNLTERHMEMLLRSLHGLGGFALTLLAETGYEQRCLVAPGILGDLGFAVSQTFTWQLNGVSAELVDSLEGTILLACLETENAGRLLAQLKQQGVFPSAVLLPVAELPVLMAQMGEDANWLVGVDCWDTSPVHGQHPLSLRTDYSRAKFVAEYRQRYLATPGLAAAEAVAALELLLIAIIREGEDGDVLAALESLAVETVVGYFNFAMGVENNTCRVVQVLADWTLPVAVFPEPLKERDLLYPAPSWDVRNCTSAMPANSRWGFNGAACSQCPDGQEAVFRTELQQRHCRDCPVGKVLMVRNAVEGSCLLDCSPGFFENAGACDPCSNGTFRSEGMPSHECHACPLGYFSQLGLAQCERCWAGTFGPAEGLPKCELCAPGTFTNGAGYSRCRRCPPGRFSAKFGASECRKCASGTIANNSGASACDSCEPGSMSVLDATRCDLCPTGRHQPGYGKSSCIEDHAGSSSPLPGTATPSNAKGYFLVRYLSVNGSRPSALIERCDAMPEACLTHEACAEGHAGRHCYSCLPGFISSGTCSRCPDRLYGVLFAAMYFFGYVVIIQLLMAMVDLASKKDCHMILFKILLNHCIAMAVLGSQIQRYITQAGLLSDNVAIKLMLEILLATDGAPEGEASWFSLSCLMQPHLGAERRRLMDQMASAQHHDFDLDGLRPAQDALRNFQRLNEIFVIMTWNLLPFLVVVFSAILCYSYLDRYMRSRAETWADAIEFYSQVCCFGGRVAAFWDEAQRRHFTQIYRKRLLGLFWPLHYMASFSPRRGHHLLRFLSLKHFWRDHLPARAAVIHLMQFAVARRNLRVLTCVDLGSRDDGISVLMRQGSVDCRPADPLLIVSLGLALLWGVGYPCAIMWGLKRDLPRLSDPSVLKRWSILVNGYARTVWWWEAAIFVRKFAFLGLEVLPVGSQARTLLFAVTCILSLYSHEVYWPFDGRQSGVLNRLERFQLWCALLPSLGGLILMQATGISKSRLPLYWTGVVATCFLCHLGFVLAWCFAFFLNPALRAASWLSRQPLPNRRGMAVPVGEAQQRSLLFNHPLGYSITNRARRFAECPA